jgi:hypothetical protein
MFDEHIGFRFHKAERVQVLEPVDNVFVEQRHFAVQRALMFIDPHTHRREQMVVQQTGVFLRSACRVRLAESTAPPPAPRHFAQLFDVTEKKYGQ